MSGQYLHDGFTLPCPPGLKIPEEEGYTITPNTLKVLELTHSRGRGSVLGELVLVMVKEVSEDWGTLCYASSLSEGVSYVGR